MFNTHASWRKSQTVRLGGESMNVNVKIECELSAGECERMAEMDRQKMDNMVFFLVKQFAALAQKDSAQNVISYICGTSSEDTDEASKGGAADELER